jgi:two-component system nitrate/nitrite response regulator NarL
MSPDSTPIRLVIADDHPIFREGLRRLLEIEARFALVGEAPDGETAVQLVRRLQPDVLLLDLQMQGLDGLRVLGELASEPGPTRVVLLTAAIDRDQILEAVHLGVRGVLLKDAATPLLYKCIERVLAGEYWLGRETVADLVSSVRQPPAASNERVRSLLTARERDIVLAVVDGASNKEIAAEFGVSPQTVKNHLSAIFDKLGVSSRLELALYAMTHGITRPPA